MKLRIAPIGIALALAATAASAATWDPLTNTWREDNFVRVEPVEVTRIDPVQPSGVIVYQEAYLSPSTPVLVERRYASEPREYVVIRDDASYYVSDLNPQTGHLIERGLFNRKGPNDFGE